MAGSADAESTPSSDEIDAISSRRFSNSFRGWDPDEVRVHLVEVAEMVRALTHRNGDLARRLAEAEAAARRADLTNLDPDEVARILGEETARVLSTAREAAAEIEAKATAQAELLARQAADDAARVRAEADEAATRIRTEAAESAEATRAAGEAHLADLQAAGEAELARAREEMEAETAAERQAARDEAALELSDAQDRASQIRSEAEAEAARVRREAEEEVAALRAEVDAEVAERRSSTDEDLRVLVERALAQVGDAERMRDRILADLARKRRAARQHLEQLHAGRDRLLAAYEVIRATTGEATRELDVVLDDARRAAGAAAERIAAEPLPSADELLAELDHARAAGLPIVAPDPALVGDEGAGVEAEAPEAETEAPAAETAAEADAPAAETAAEADAPAAETAAEASADVPVIEGAVEATTGTAEGDADPGESGDTGAAETDDPERSEPAAPPAATEPTEPARPARFDPPAAAVARSDEPTGEPTGDVVAAGSDETPGDATQDAASGIFARLRAEADKASPGDPAEAAASAQARTAVATKPAAEPRAADTPARPEAKAKATTKAKPKAKSAAPEPAGDPAGPDTARIAELFERRDAAVDEVARRLAKRLKRMLSDQQSELLDELRRHRGVPGVDELLGEPDAFAVSWHEPIRADLQGAVAAGVAFAGDLDQRAVDHPDVDLDVPTRELIESIAAPLRARLVRALGEDTAGGDDEDDAQAADDLELADRIRACYREWRGARLASSVADAAAHAFGLGIRGALPASVGLRWYCGPGDAPCSDCNDNELEGVVAAGVAFPTGQHVAPAHPGCRCLAMPELD